MKSTIIENIFVFRIYFDEILVLLLIETINNEMKQLVNFQIKPYENNIC